MVGHQISVDDFRGAGRVRAILAFGISSAGFDKTLWLYMEAHLPEDGGGVTTGYAVSTPGNEEDYGNLCDAVKRYNEL